MESLLTTEAPDQPCPDCRETAPPDGYGYCPHCGARRVVVAASAELDLGTVAGVTDVGRRRAANEDALAIARAPGVSAAVVCDGISTATRADVASGSAVRAAITSIMENGAGHAPEAALLQAATRAGAAATARAAGELAPNPPSCTLVAGIVTAGSVAVAWLGDSRAYWLPVRGEPRCVTVDDSLAGQLGAAGVPVSGADPRSRALLRWIGADAPAGPAHTAVFSPEGPGTLVLCSDGLSHYFDAAGELAAAVPAGDPSAVARTLVDLANARGGHDNVTVAVLPFPIPEEGGNDE
ncbi:protein phosphatase 2C domain-containing protein [Virgisporangium aliadipatigenens]|uniref:protein phosphatase 2C domain-containing protein n=1 Tax=Virgisporangium aliadipatigenens TaxID=741659 RepID=UPI003570D4B8